MKVSQKLCLGTSIESFTGSSSGEQIIIIHLRSRVRIEVRPTENDSTQLYKNGDISVVITCS